jgi:hypothetical protein
MDLKNLKNLENLVDLQNQHLNEIIDFYIYRIERSECPGPCEVAVLRKQRMYWFKRIKKIRAKGFSV